MLSRSLSFVVLVLWMLASGSPSARAAHDGVEARIRVLSLMAAGKDAETLQRDPMVAQIARDHSEAMWRRDRLSHTLEGVGPAERLARHHRSLFGLAAENVGMRRGGLDRETLAQALVEGWMESPGHRANLLADYQILEVGCAGDATTVYCTQLFVRRPDRLAGPVDYGQRPGSALNLGLAPADASVERRVAIAPRGQEASTPGVAVVEGRAQLALPAASGVYQLELWTEVEPEADRYRIVPGPLLCVASAAAAGTPCAGDD